MAQHGGPPVRGPLLLLLALLVVVGLAASVPDLSARLGAERANHTVALVADQPDFLALAATSGVPVAQVLGKLRTLGVTAVGVPEETLEDLDAQGEASLLSGASWLALRTEAGLPALVPPIDATGTYALVPAGDAALAAFIAAGLRTALGPGQGVTSVPAGPVVAIGTSAPLGVASQVPLGFWPASFDPARTAGLAVMPRPSSTPAPEDAAALTKLFAQIDAAGVPVHTVLFAGLVTQRLPGDPDQLGTLGDLMRARGWRLGVREDARTFANVDQPGTTQLAAALGTAEIRVYSVPPWLLQDRTEQETVTSLVGSVEERNLRILYLHPYASGSDPLARTLTLYRDTAQTLVAHGYTLGTPQPLVAVRTTPILRLLQGVGVLAAGLLLLQWLFFGLLPWLVYLLAAGTAGLAALTWLAPAPAADVCALGAGVAFGGLAMRALAEIWPRTAPARRSPGRLGPRAGRRPGPGRVRRHLRPALSWGRLWLLATGLALAVAVITGVGGVYSGTLLGDWGHMLSWSAFRGVKAIYLLVPLAAFCAFLAVVEPESGVPPVGRGGVSRAWGLSGFVRWVVGQPLRYLHVLVFGLIGGAAVVYLIRSGNGGAALVPGIETHLRDFLQRELVFRPREKEFLVGYPALYLAVAAARARRPWLFALLLVGASAAPVSLADTFDHLHTPYLFSLARSGVGLALGLLTGSLALAAAWLGTWLWHAAVQRPPALAALPGLRRGEGA